MRERERERRERERERRRRRRSSNLIAGYFELPKTIFLNKKNKKKK